MVTVNNKQCAKIVKIIKGMELPPDKEELTEFILKEDVLKNFYFSLVSICHQTTPINGQHFEGHIDGKLYRGWDYLREKWFIATKNNSELVYSQCLAAITYNDLVKIFSEEGCKTLLYDIENRVRLLNNIGEVMQKNKFKSIQDIYDKSKGYLVLDDGNGILNLLKEFKAYTDPVQKKSLYFLLLMKNHSFWAFKDENNLGPPIDYHEIRGHLRLGTVEIIDDQLKEKVLNQIEINQEEDLYVRKSVYEAIMFISQETRYSASVLHYFFWNYFRNCCNRNQPHCFECLSSCGLPERYKILKKQLKTKKCLFFEACNSINLKEKFIEPSVWTEYY
ncbi:MAG TPA: hypothetical protein VIR55_13895 [Ignavibacteria bacterium]